MVVRQRGRDLPEVLLAGGKRKVVLLRRGGLHADRMD